MSLPSDLPRVRTSTRRGRRTKTSTVIIVITAVRSSPLSDRSWRSSQNVATSSPMLTSV
ncbi:Uncharacterised protein [Mycobacteroides abscessus subsp. abscessus]|nr:Uncharacterised protein [Mycobacteroides abscessus subsp. abscessus]